MEMRKHLEKYGESFTESGFSKKFVLNFPNLTEMKLEPRSGKDGYMHYEGLQAYIEANTKVEALPFDKLDYLFRIWPSS